MEGWAVDAAALSGGIACCRPTHIPGKWWRSRSDGCVNEYASGRQNVYSETKMRTASNSAGRWGPRLNQSTPSAIDSQKDLNARATRRQNAEGPCDLAAATLSARRISR